MAILKFVPCLNWLALAALVIPFATLAQDRTLMISEQRVALVIGNSSYKVSPLKNPVNDAEDIAGALRAFGFRVTLRKDATHQQMIEAINSFGQELRKGGVGLFYFAGHGIQSRGNNFLIPVNANLGSETQLEFDTVNANRVLAAMDDANNRVNIMILDACRDNPFARNFRTSSRGLAQMEAAKGTYVAFATGPGSVAADGTGRNGVYTEYLLRSLQQPESDIDRVFRRVAGDVSRATNYKQVPWTSSSLTGDFYFRADTNVATILPSTPQTDLSVSDSTFWNSIKDSLNPSEFNAYLDQFPNGMFSALARMRLAKLKVTPPPAQVATLSPIAPSLTPQVEMHTSMGTITLELYPENAPETVRNFLQYAKEGFYNGTIFHRVIGDFMIQGGGFSADLSAKKTRDPIRHEGCNGRRNQIGTVAMARTADPNSATSQFFINVADNQMLDYRGLAANEIGYCVFGRVIKGLDILNKIKTVGTVARPPHANVPAQPVTIERVTLL